MPLPRPARGAAEEQKRAAYVVDGNLVIGDPAKGKRVRSPILRDARLAVLHPEILAVAEQLFRDEHSAAAVFEAANPTFSSGMGG